MVELIQNAVPMKEHKMLSLGFNKSKKTPRFFLPKTDITAQMQSLSTVQCYGKNPWPEIDKLQAWMVSAETSAFMKMGGLGVVASELPEAYNKEYGALGDNIIIVTPLYVGDTGKKKALFNPETYEYKGVEGVSLFLKKITTIEVPFINHEKLVSNRVGVFVCEVLGVTYVLLENEHFFSIQPHKENPSAQDGCYVLNVHNVNEVERFAFFSKAVCVLLKDVLQNRQNPVMRPNLIIANDWHCGAMAPLMKMASLAQEEQNFVDSLSLAEKIRQIPIVHIAHHLGYQGWDYPNTQRILNSLFEYSADLIYKNAKAVKNANPRTQSSIMVYDTYNQANGHIQFADRVVTVSKNYAEEVSKFLEFGWDFRDILKIRKDHRTFLGIVNGYEKSKIVPSPQKISHINQFFKYFSFETYDESNLIGKVHDKAEFIRLLNRLAVDEAYKQDVLPLLDFYNFESLDIKNPDKVPFFCATSRMVEQKGYDIAAEAILLAAEDFLNNHPELEMPVFVLGGAGDSVIFDELKRFKDKIAEINPELGKRIFVFRGYKDEFAYAIQLAADFYMMPCRFEPCGLTQMEALAKGTLPVAMSTGGLVDTIINGVDGFRSEVFFVGDVRVYGSNLASKRLKNNVNAYADLLKNVLKVFYENSDEIQLMKINAMKKDFSWNKGPLEQYYKLFHLGI